jgi:hypothetical protein
VTESGGPIAAAEGLRVISRYEMFLVCDAQSGTYHFVSHWKDQTQPHRIRS